MSCRPLGARLFPRVLLPLASNLAAGRDRARGGRSVRPQHGGRGRGGTVDGGGGTATARSSPGGRRLTSTTLAVSGARSAAGRVRAQAPAAGQPCQHSAAGPAFEAFHIRTSEPFFILRRKVRVSQPGRSLRGNCTSLCRASLSCVVAVRHRREEQAAGPRGHRRPGWGGGDHLGDGGLLGGAAQTEPGGTGCCWPRMTSPVGPLPSP